MNKQSTREQEAAELEAQFEGRELDKQIHELTSNLDDEFEDNDPNASILNALADF